MMLSRRDFSKMLLLASAGQSFPSFSFASESTIPDQSTLKGFYVPGWFGVTRSRVDHRLALLKEFGFNALMIDVKNAHGELFYAPENVLARSIGAQAKTDAGHRRSLLTDYIRSRADNLGIRLIGRHVMFRDTILHDQKEDYRLLRRGAERWVDPRNSAVIDYNLELLAQESRFGFDELVLDYIRFPEIDAYGTLEQKNAFIAAVVEDASAVVKSAGLDFSVQVFGYAAWDYRSAAVGQDIELLAPFSDTIYPMLYPNHFRHGSLGFERPDHHPYEVLSLGYQAAMNQKISSQVMPMIQSFNCAPWQVSEQLRAVEELGMPGAVCWNPRGRYAALEEALSSAKNGSDLQIET